MVWRFESRGLRSTTVSNVVLLVNIQFQSKLVAVGPSDDAELSKFEKRFLAANRES